MFVDSQASGVEVRDECLEAMEDIKFKKNIRWVSYKISDDKKYIEVGEKCKKAAGEDEKEAYKEFVKNLDGATPRYFVYSFSYTLADGGERDKLVFIPW